MKTILVLLILLICAHSVLADVGIPVEESYTTEKIATIGSTVLALGNLMMIVGKVPSYWVGGASLGAGLYAWSLAAQDPKSYGTSLWISGLSAIATGVAAVGYRHVLNQQQQVRLEPAWNDGAPALALVIDF